MDTKGTQKHLPAVGFLIIVGLVSLFTRLNISVDNHRIDTRHRSSAEAFVGVTGYPVMHVPRPVL